MVHESTNAFIPDLDPESDPNATLNSVRERAASRGHSLPQTAAYFAKQSAAHKLILNHISPRYPLPDPDTIGGGESKSLAIIQEIRNQAAQAWGKSVDDVTVASDMLTVEIPRRLEGADALRERY